MLFHALLLSLTLARGMDATTTLTCPQPCREVNPMMVNPFVHPRWFTVQVAVETAGQVYLLNRVHRHHPKLAVVLTAASIGIASAAVAHNIGQRKG